MKTLQRRVRPEFDLLEDRLAPAVFWVVNNLDNNVGGFNNMTMRNEGSLRWCINQANAQNDRDQILFAIPGNATTITLNKALPDLTITNPLDILGNTQVLKNGLPAVTIDGNGRDYGLSVQGTDATINSLCIRNDAKDQILINNGSNSQVMGCLIGINAADQVSGGDTGVHVTNSSNVKIGSSTARNIIAGNNINVSFEKTSNSFIQGNYIGTNIAGTKVAGRTHVNVQLDNQSNSNMVGGTALTPGTGQGNVIANGYWANVAIYNQSNSNQVAGNLIGLDKTGQNKLGSSIYGVVLMPDENGSYTDTYPQNNIIGGTDLTNRNIISGAVNSGILIGSHGGTYNTKVQSNYIGTNIDGTVAVPNRFGVFISSSGNLIGGVNLLGLPDGMGLPPGNLIAGNSSVGINISGYDVNEQTIWYASNNTIQGNLIGTDKTGNAKLGTQSFGIQAKRYRNLTIGGGAGAGNCISGNTTGIDLRVGLTSTIIQGNMIGTNKQGLGKPNLGNGSGIRTDGVSGLVIGGVSNGARPPGNIISGNTSDGINTVRTDSTIQGNFIGLDRRGAALPNSGNGISISLGFAASGGTITGTSGNGVGPITITSNGHNLETGQRVTIQGVLGNTNANGTFTITVIDGNTFSLNGTTGNGNYGGGGTWAAVYTPAVKASVTIGGTAQGAGNTIGSNGKDGIYVSGGGNTGLVILGNIVGLDPFGAAVRANQVGIHLDGVNAATVGSAAAPNIVSGNQQQGILVERGYGNRVIGNKVGSDKTGQTALVNTAAAIRVTGALGATVVRDNTGFHGKGVASVESVNNTGTLNNIAVGNNRIIQEPAAPGGMGASLLMENSTGVAVAQNIWDTGALLDGTGTFANWLTGNYVGVDDNNQSYGNTLSGIVVQNGANNNAIGLAGNGNTIAFNGEDGVSLLGPDTNGNTLTANNIHDNSGAGVNLVAGTGTALTGNTITNNQQGLVVNAGVTDTIQDNTITQNTTVDMNLLGGQTTAVGSLGVAGTVQQTGGLLDIQGTLTVQTSYALDDGTVSVGTLTDDGTLTQLGGTLQGDGTATVAQALTWSGGTMSGSGTTDLKPGGNLTINGPVTLNTRTVLNEGDGIWNGTIGGGGGTLRNTGSLSGTGTLTGALSDAGDLYPGGDQVPGTITVIGSYTETGTLHFDLGEVGDPSDLIVASTVNLSGNLDLSALGPDLADSYTLIHNTGGAPVNGIFNGLPEGDLVPVGGRVYQISYKGNGGYDVVLNTPAEPPSTTATVTVIDEGGTYNGSPFAATASVVGSDGIPGPTLEGVGLTVTYYAGPTATGDPLPGAPTDSGTYTVVASFPGSADYDAASSLMTFTINSVGPIPVATADTFTVEHDQVLQVTAPGVLANDTGADGATLVTNVSDGTLTWDGDGSFIYQPAPGFVGTDSFTYQDANGGAPTTVTLTVTDVAPVAQDATYQTGPGQTLNVSADSGLLTNATDSDGDQISNATVVSGPSNGALTLNADGSFAYIPNAGFVGADTFTYTVTADGLTSAPATVTLNVANQAPTAGNIGLDVIHDQPLTFSTTDLLANATDPQGYTLTAAIVTGPSDGTLTDNGDGTFTYMPNPGFVGTDTLTYQVSDGFNTSNTTLSLVVHDAPPDASNDVLYTAYNQTLTITTADLTDTAINPDGDTLTAAIVTGPSDGTLTDNGDGTFTYTPDVGFVGTESFTYQASNGISTSDAATVQVVVHNWAPQAFDATYQVAVNGQLTVAANNGVLSDAYDDEGDAITASLASGPSNGTLTLNADGSFTYTPNAGFVGTDSFTFTASDGNSNSDLGTVTLSVSAPPTATDVSAVTTTGQPVAVNVLNNVRDASGAALTVSAVTQGAFGTVIINPDNTVTYTPDAGFVGTDSFTYQASDGVNTSNTATVQVVVHNWAPQAFDATYQVAVNGQLTVAANNGVLSDAYDDTGDAITASLANGPSNGTLTLNADGSFTYTPNAGFVGTDSFTFTASDGNSTSDPGTVTLSVSAPLTATDVSAVTTTGQPVVVNVLDNASGAALTVSAVTQGAFGTVIVNPDNTVTYTPDPGAASDDTFTYTVSDGNGDTATATVQVVVHDWAPQVFDATYQVAVNGQLTVAANNGVLSDAYDDEGDAITASLASGPSNGTLTLNADGSFTYTPNAGFVGTDSFTFTASDGNSNSDLGTVTLSVSAPPTATDVSAVTTTGQPVAVNVLNNVSDASGAALTVSAVTQGAFGTVIINPDNTVTYTPNPGAVGDDTFTYTVSDGNGDTATATVYVSIYGSGQWASSVVDFSSQNSTGSAAALGAPDTLSYGPSATAWSPASQGGTTETLTLGFDTAVNATGFTIRETSGNGFVTRVDLIDTDGIAHTVWMGADTTPTGGPDDLIVNFGAPTSYLTCEICIYTDTDLAAGTFEGIDAVQLSDGTVNTLTDSNPTGNNPTGGTLTVLGLGY